MSSITMIQELTAENARLQKEMEELEFLIEMKEEELDELKQAAAQIAFLQSNLTKNLEELDIVKYNMREAQEKLKGAQKRENALEEEIIYSIETEKNYYELKEEYQASLNTIEIQQEELKTTPSLVIEMKNLRSRLAEAMSEIELLQLDNQYLREDLQQLQNRPPDFLTEENSI